MKAVIAQAVPVDAAFDEDVCSGIWECECGWYGYPRLIILEARGRWALRLCRRCDGADLKVREPLACAN